MSNDKLHVDVRFEFDRKNFTVKSKIYPERGLLLDFSKATISLLGGSPNVVIYGSRMGVMIGLSKDKPVQPDLAALLASLDQDQIADLIKKGMAGKSQEATTTTTTRRRGRKPASS